MPQRYRGQSAKRWQTPSALCQYGQMWTDDFISELRKGIDDPGISVVNEDDILDFTRQVARGSERKNAPLATFLAGWYVGTRVSQGADPQEAWSEAAEIGRQLLER